MKFSYFVLFLSAVFLLSCGQDDRNWDVDTKPLTEKVTIIDIRKDYYSAMPISEFRQKYPFFLNPEEADSVYDTLRKDKIELQINDEITKVVSKINLEKELTELFEHVQYYFPDFKTPKVYLVNSMAMAEINNDLLYTPILYNPQKNEISVSMECFLGTGNKLYADFGVERHLQKTMNADYLIPKISLELARNIVPIKKDDRTFLNKIIYNGKLMLVQDALLPKSKDYLKIGYTEQELNWSYENERNMWDYFVRNEYVYSDNEDLARRFLDLQSPFSKFFISDENEKSVDLQSPGGAGVWLGWQIVRKYANKNEDKKLVEILADIDYQKLFNESNYKPE